jgi:hypothetical protein
MVFRFLTGFAGSAFLSVSGGAISDVFKNENVATYVRIIHHMFGTDRQAHDGVLRKPFPRPRTRATYSGLHQPECELALDILCRHHLGSGHVIPHIGLCTRDFRSSASQGQGCQVSLHVMMGTVLMYSKRRETGDERWKAPTDLADRSFVAALQKSIKTPFSKLSQPLPRTE